MAADDETEARPARVVSRRYELLEPIGAGGFGAVYKAHDRLLQRLVAVKLHRTGATMTPHARERFLREARAAARLQHPNVVSIYDAGEDGDDVFLVLELVHGRSLLEVMKGGTVGARKAETIVIAVARALGAAHRLGIVHRDIKPGNILISDDDAVKVTDFGIARLSDETEITRDGAVVGTPRYMSPEQLEAKEVGPASDLFSLGCVAYEMVAGRPPFGGETLPEVIANVVGGNMRPMPPALRKDAPRLAETIERLLQRQPAARPSSAEEVVERLSSETNAIARRRFVRNALVAAAVVALIAVIGSLVMRRDRAREVVRTLNVKNRGVVERLANAGGKRPSTDKRFPVAIGGLSFHLRHAAGNSVEIHAAAHEIEDAVHVLALHDVLYDYRFDAAPNLFTSDQAERQTVSIKTHELPPDALIEVLASAARWPVVFDASAAAEVRRRLGGSKARPIEVSGPWDQITTTLIEQYGLATLRFERVWLIGSKQRCRALMLRRPQTTLSLLTLMNLDDAARALRTASSETGSVLVNRRLSSLIVSDYSDVIARQMAILSQLDGVDRNTGGRTRFVGKQVDIHLRDASIHEVIAIVKRITGVSVIVAPNVTGTVSMHLDGVPWDEAFEAALAATGNTFAVRHGVLEVTADVKPEEEMVVETVKLRREDPEFFADWKIGLSPGGSIVIDRKARLLIIKDRRSNAIRMRTEANNVDRMMSEITKARIGREIQARGLAAGIALQQRMKATNRDFDLDESNWNDVGYWLLRNGEKKLAVEVFERVVAEHPQSANAYDSLAEGYLESGERELAIRNYRKSLELDRENGNAKQMLKKLGV